jgi:hypothetical protein
MLLLKRNKKNKNSAAKEMPIEIINRWRAAKRRLATYLQQRSELMSMSLKKFSLIFFCVLFGGSSIAIVIHSATTKEQSVSVTTISKPARAGHDEITSLKSDSVITKREYEKIIGFKNYLLHLKTYTRGRKQYDSIISVRPKLMDSIILFEKLYLSQK